MHVDIPPDYISDRNYSSKWGLIQLDEKGHTERLCNSFCTQVFSGLY